MESSSTLSCPTKANASIFLYPSSDALSSRPTLQPSKKKRKISSPPESAVTPNKRSCLYPCTQRSSITQSAQTSALSRKTCRPFWNKSSKAWSTKLWLPTDTDCVDMKQSSWSSSLSTLAQSSWFTVKQRTHRSLANCQRIYPPSSRPYLWHTITAGIPEQAEEKKCLDNQKKSEPYTSKQPIPTKKTPKKEKPPAAKAHRIRLYPNTAQKQKLMAWFGVVRWTYNKCVAAIQQQTVSPNRKALRQLALNKSSLEAKYPWALRVPYDVRDAGMIDVLKAIKSNRAKKKQTKFHLKFRTRRDPQQSIVIHHKHWGQKRGMYSDLVGPKTIRAVEELPEKLLYDSRLIRTRLGHYYMCIPQPLSVRSENQAPSCGHGAVVALDPGVRAFMTAYDTGGRATSWGNHDTNRLERLSQGVAKLQRKWSTPDVRHRRRYRLKRAGRRIRLKIRNLVDDLHKRLAKWLCRNFRCILIPKFQVTSMVARGNRKIRKKTVRGVYNWAHYRFRQRLLSKAREYPWCKVVVTEEPYTSKTCGSCGWVDHNLGGKPVFTCRQCPFVCDRDVNGARNVLLRYLSLYVEAENSNKRAG